TGCDRALARVASHIPAERASEYTGTLARLRGARAKALTDLGRHPEALAEWGRAIAAAGTAPDDPQRSVWPRAGRAWSLARAGAPARAGRTRPPGSDARPRRGGLPPDRPRPGGRRRVHRPRRPGRAGPRPPGPGPRDPAVWPRIPHGRPRPGVAPRPSRFST